MSCCACFATSGTSWSALAPVPITATRLPASECWCCHRAEWKAGPAKRSSPGIAGSFGRLSCPTALISACGDQRLLGAALRAHAHLPARVALVEARGNDFGLEADVLAHAVLARAALEVVPQLRVLREELRPVVVGLERVAIEVVGDVDAAARVGVLEPGAAHAGILLDHGVGDAGLPRAGSRPAGPTCRRRSRARGSPASPPPERRDPTAPRARSRHRAPAPPASSARIPPAPARRPGSSSSRGSSRATAAAAACSRRRGRPPARRARAREPRPSPPRTSKPWPSPISAGFGRIGPRRMLVSPVMWTQRQHQRRDAGALERARDEGVVFGDRRAGGPQASRHGSLLRRQAERSRRPRSPVPPLAERR